MGGQGATGIPGECSLPFSCTIVLEEDTSVRFLKLCICHVSLGTPGPQGFRGEGGAPGPKGIPDRPVEMMYITVLYAGLFP